MTDKKEKPLPPASEDETAQALSFDTDFEEFEAMDDERPQFFDFRTKDENGNWVASEMPLIGAYISEYELKDGDGKYVDTYYLFRDLEGVEWLVPKHGKITKAIEKEGAAVRYKIKWVKQIKIKSTGHPFNVYNIQIQRPAAPAKAE